jgi:hypothetical protein
VEGGALPDTDLTDRDHSKTSVETSISGRVLCLASSDFLDGEKSFILPGGLS